MSHTHPEESSIVESKDSAETHEEGDVAGHGSTANVSAHVQASQVSAPLISAHSAR